MDGKAHSDEVSNEKQEHDIGHRMMGHPCYKVSKKFTELCSSSSVL